MVQWKWWSAGRETWGEGQGGASERQGIKSSHSLLKAAKGCDDSVAVWWKTGVGQGREGGGAEQKKKTMLTDGMKGGELIDLLSACFSEQTEAPAFIPCNANVTRRTLNLGIWKYASNSAIQHVCMMQIKWLSKCLSEKHCNLLND